MKVKVFLFSASVLLAGSFFFTSCEKEQDLLEENAVLQEKEIVELKTTDSEDQENQKLKHIILVEFIDDITAEQKDGFTAALLALKDSIDLVQDIEWGQDLKIQQEFSKNFTHCYLMTFLNLHDFIAYLYHPALESFHTIWLPFVKNVMVFDYMSNDVETQFTNMKRQPWLRHLVLFNYDDDISDEVKNQIVEEYTTLPQEIMHIRKMEWGSEMLLLGLNMDYEDGFLLSFSGLGSYFKFMVHPERIRFAQNYVVPNVEDVLIFDYIVQPRNKPPYCPHPRHKGSRGKHH
jgi:hypothetical protein